jgi:hypothetical protein
MKCSYHPTADSQDICSTCTRPLCPECSHRIKGKTYCQDCLVEGAEWAATIKQLRIPADAPRRAAVCAVIPGMGAVYNNEYVKALTYFAVFAALVVMGDRVHGIFGFGSFVFLIFTMFDSYRTAEQQARARIEGVLQPAPDPNRPDKAVVGWGILLIVMGALLLLQINLPYRVLNRAWPLAFILLGGYLVYGAVRDRFDGGTPVGPVLDKKEFQG